MIVCVCNAISDQEIKDWVELGGSTMSELSDDLGLGTCCGSCRDCASQIVAESVRASTQAVDAEADYTTGPSADQSGFVAMTVARAVGP